MSELVALTPTQKPFIDCDDIAVNLNGRVLFEHTCWSIESGQHWGIIGPNHSGKSLLAQVIAAKIPIAQGRILYYFQWDSPQGRVYFHRGEIVLISPDHHRNLLRRSGGYYQARWQSFEGENGITVAEFLTGERIERISPFEVTPLGTTEKEYRERRDKALKLLEIEYLPDRKIIHLSNGESRKVLLVQALMQSPKLLILDDPFIGLDQDSRTAVTKAINLIIKEGRTQVLLVTSRIAEIPEGITHILKVSDYRIVSMGPKDKFNPEEAPAHKASKPPLANPDPCPNINTGLNHSPLLEMRNVSVTYDGIPILSGINWTVNPGERWLLVGHNGAGKSTLLSLILGDNPQAYANDIRIFGKPFATGTEIREVKRRIGLLSPEFQLFYPGDWTCMEAVCSGFFDSIGLYETCSPEQKKIATGWLRRLGVQSLADLPLNRISTGEQRLVLLARALVKNPALLILDEPCIGLDYIYRRRITGILDEICQTTPLSLIYVTHHPDEIPGVITHELRLKKGRILQNRAIINPKSAETFKSGIRSQAKYLGRFDFSDPSGPIFAWPGSSIIVRFKGSGISAVFKPINGQDNWLNIIIDHNDPQPIRIDSQRTYILAAGLTPGVHQLVIFKRTEASCGEIQFQGFKLPSDSELLEPPAPANRKMEFIGDSITCGYGNEAARIEDGFKPEQENNYLAYGSITARNLNADSITLAWSGKGVYRNYGGDKVEPLPELYGRTLPSRNSLWNFQTWIPDVVVINLGTNDFSATINKAAFSAAYRKFLASIRQHYPNAAIFCVIGPLSLEPAQYIKKIVAQFNASGDDAVYYLEFPLQDIKNNGIGGDSHPSIKTHSEMAKQLTKAIRAQLKW